MTRREPPPGPVVERKVSAAAGGGGIGAAVAGVIVWALSEHAFPDDPGTLAVEQTPGPVVLLVMLGVPALLSVAGAWLGGWLAPHTPRPDLCGQQIDGLVIAYESERPA